MASTDWFAEMLRLRLLEVYDRDLVDQLIPFKPEHTMQFEHSAETVLDIDLERINMLEDEELNYASLYTVD